MSNQGKFLIFAGAIILLAMLAGGSNTRSSFLKPPPATGPNCYFQSDGYCAALGSFYNALDASEERKRSTASPELEKELERFRSSPEGRKAQRDLREGLEIAERRNRAKGWIDNPYERSGN